MRTTERKDNIDRKKVYVIPSALGTTIVYDFDAGNARLVDFLTAFDVWGSNGHFHLTSDENNQYLKFECGKAFYKLALTEDFKNAFHRFGVEVTDDYEKVEKLF